MLNYTKNYTPNIFSGSIHVFAFLTHAHHWAYSIRGYKVSSNAAGNVTDVEEIAEGNPQWPQRFYYMPKETSLANGDSLMARCSYNTMDSSNDISIGESCLIR